MSLVTKKTNKIVKDKKVKTEPKKGINYVFFFATSIVGILTGGIFAYNLKWIGDDIFIGLRYVENFLAGNGLVYNVGERVEGYTDFLWLMMISFFQYLKFDPAETSIYLGLFFAIVTLLVITFISFKLQADKGLKYFVPLSLFMLALNYDFAVWATGGLETMFYTFLLISAFGVYFFTRLDHNKRLFISGLLMCFALLTRPDAAMFFGIANIFLLLRNIILKTPVKKLITEQLLFSSAVLLIYIPYFIWRYNYYGQFFPNTYYSKVAYDSYYTRGFYYLWLYFQCHFTTFLFFLSIPVLLNVFIQQGDSKQRSFRNALLSVTSNNQLAAFTVAVISVSFYLIFFVAKVGGDFMYARFVIPCLPLICFIIEYSLYALPIIKYKKRYGFIVLLLLSAVIAESTIREDFFLVDENGQKVLKEKHGIDDERYFYISQPQWEIGKIRKFATYLRPYFNDLDVKVLSKGGEDWLVYYAKFKTCIDEHGLTDTVISHIPIKERGGKIADEKIAPYDYMIKRGIDFVFTRKHYKQDTYRFIQINTIDFNLGGEIITYQRKLIKTLKERMGQDFIYTDFESYLDNYIQNVMPGKSKAEIKKDYEDFKQYYFLQNDDKEREAVFLSKI